MLQKIPSRLLSSCRIVYSGHSKWQNIKHTKARNDAKRSTMNTKIAHMITVAAREGGGPDVSKNVRLATAVDNALKQNLSKKVIQAAISRADKSTAGAAGEAQSIKYEGVGPGGVAVLVEALTENKNRTAQMVRSVFGKYNGGLSPVQYLFERKGWIELAPKHNDYNAVFEQVLDYGVEDVVASEGSIFLYTKPVNLASVAKQVKQNYELADMGVSFEPIADHAITGLHGEQRAKLDAFIAELENLDDVTNVYTNCT